MHELQYIKPTSLNLFCKGENQVLSHLYKVIVSELHLVAYRYVKCEAEAEDIVADCFEKLLKMPNDRRIQKFISNKINIKAMLFIMVRNQSLDVLKINKNRSRILENIQKEFPMLAFNESLTNTTQSNFDALLATLPVKEKTVAVKIGTKIITRKADSTHWKFQENIGWNYLWHTLTENQNVSVAENPKYNF